MNESIAAISTPFGMSGICVVRVSGTLAKDIALKLTHRKALRTRYAHFCQIYADGKFIDEAIVLFFAAPNSFTGEDVAEFQLHGSTSVAQIVLNECVAFGARLAKPGEFSKRACLNGKMSALKALSINELIHAKNEKAAHLIAQNLSGKLGELLDKIRADLVRTLAYTETSIDYADDDLPSDLLEKTRDLYKENARVLRQIVELSRSRKGLVEGFKIAIIGRANVGKSSLLNALLGKNRAIVSDIEGTTRDRVEESLNLGTHLVRLIDTAGLRKSEDEIEQIGINLSLNALKEADIIVALFDRSREFEEADGEILTLLEKSEKKIFFVLNKSDLPPKFKLPREFKAFENNALKSEIQALNGEIYSEFKAFENRALKKEIHGEKNLNSTENSKFNAENTLNFIEICTKSDINPLKMALLEHLNSLDSDGFIITNAALLQSLENAALAIDRAEKVLENSSLELFAFECNTAISELAKYTKAFDNEEILDEMFGNFCLGK